MMGRGMLGKIGFGRRLWCCILAVEILLGGALFGFGRQEDIEINFSQEDLLYETGEKGFYQDVSTGSFITTPEFTLPGGLYTIEAEYERSNEAGTRIEVLYSDAGCNREISGNINLFDDHHASCDFRVKYGDRPIQARGRISGDAVEGDYILIRNLRITTASRATGNLLFRIAAFFVTADGLLLLFMLRDRLFVNKESKDHCKVLLLVIFFSSIPLMIDYTLNGHDLGFHLLRIEGLKEGLQNGIFPVKILPNWLGGHGYAVSVFYGDFFLYIPAVLRIFGVSIQAAYKFYMLLVNIATVLLAYYSFSRMSNARTGLVCTIAYSLNIYRLTCMYTRAAVGEYTAMIFWPLVFYGFWKAYTLPEESDEHGKSWLTIALGCVGIFFSHMISTEIAAFFIILGAAASWRKVFRKKTFRVFIKAAAVIAGLSVWFLVPFVDYMMNGTFEINSSDMYQAYGVEDAGITIAQLFMLDYSPTGHSTSIEEGIAQCMPLTVGCALLFVLVGWFVFCMGKGEDNKEKRKPDYFVVFLCVLSIWMTTASFPYTWLAEKIPFLRHPISSLQFPWRFFSFASIILTYLLCMVLNKDWIDDHKKKLFAGILVGISVCQSLSYMSKCLGEFGTVRIYQEGNMSTYDLTGQYFPLDGEPLVTSTFVNQLDFDADAISLEEWHREDAALMVSLTNHSNQISQVEVPLLLYKGYQAVTDKGEQLQIQSGKSCRISVLVPPSFQGSFKVEFKEPWYWRVCELISLFTAAGVLVIYIKRKYLPDRANGMGEEQ